MKKIFSLVLVFVMMMSFSVTAFAEGNVTTDSTATIDISASYKVGAAADV